MNGITYAQSFSDHSYLWETYGAADDMTGRYVDQDDLARLLRSPSKATACKCLISQIEYWFSVGPDSFGNNPLDRNDKRLQEIAERYGQEIPR